MRILFSIVIFAGYCVSVNSYLAWKSPGTVSVKNTLGGYVTTAFVREDAWTTALFIFALLLFMAAWFSLILCVARTAPKN